MLNPIDIISIITFPKNVYFYVHFMSVSTLNVCHTPIHPLLLQTAQREIEKWSWSHELNEQNQQSKLQKSYHGNPYVNLFNGDIMEDKGETWDIVKWSKLKSANLMYIKCGGWDCIAIAIIRWVFCSLIVSYLIVIVIFFKLSTFLLFSSIQNVHKEGRER